jgi:glucose/arabinose dehydrogenase
LLVLVFASAALAADDGKEYAPLPPAPAGFKLRQLAAMPRAPVRLAGDPDGKRLYVLCEDGDVYRIDLPHGKPTLAIDHSTYLRWGKEGGQCVGLAVARDGRMYVVDNEYDLDARPQMNRAKIFRSTSHDSSGNPSGMTEWFAIDIPFAIDVFQHSVNAIVEGPDGFLYVTSGSRTDHGEAGTDPTRYDKGEVDASACVWRLDAKSDRPQLEIFARGLRNAFGLCFDDQGRLFGTENGPNADPPEEINRIERGKHYGFPYVFSDWTGKAYADQPDAPPGQSFEPPIMNVGPAGGATTRPIGTLDPHSSPSGIVHLSGNEWPESARGSFLVARFGNLLPLAKDVGFDVLQVTLTDGGMRPLRAEVKPFLSGLSRPTDLQIVGKGKVYICEIWRQTRNGGEQQPGRILELSSDLSRIDFSP